MPKLHIKITKRKKNYPLQTNHHLRNPGSFIHEKIQKILDNDALPLIITPPIFVAFVSLEWWHWYQKMPTPSPILLTLIALGLSVYCFYKFIAYKKRSKKRIFARGS
jgi:hypothetical protein